MNILWKKYPEVSATNVNKGWKWLPHWQLVISRIILSADRSREQKVEGKIMEEMVESSFRNVS